jgi:hypothetical protein
MKRCNVGYGSYNSLSCTPEGFGFRAQQQLAGVTKKGRDNKWYVVVDGAEGCTWVLFAKKNVEKK